MILICSFVLNFDKQMQLLAILIRQQLFHVVVTLNRVHMFIIGEAIIRHFIGKVKRDSELKICVPNFVPKIIIGTDNKRIVAELNIKGIQ